MTVRILSALVVASIVLAGCADDADEPPVLTEADCAAMEQVLEDVNGTLMCVTPPPPASITIEGMPNLSPAHTEIAFAWILDAPTPEAHAMRTEVRVSKESVADEALTGPDDYGKAQAKFEHQDFQPGARYDGLWRPTDAGTYFVRAYALVNGQDIWSQELTVEVTSPEPTGVEHKVTFPFNAAVSGPSPARIEINLGDHVVFQNDGFVARELVFTGPSDVGPVTAPSQGASDAVVFLEPGTYSYSSAEQDGGVSGEVVVFAP